MNACTQCRSGAPCAIARRISFRLFRALREEPVRGAIKPMRVKCLQDELTGHKRGFPERKRLPAGESRAAKALRKQEQDRRWRERAVTIERIR